MSRPSQFALFRQRRFMPFFMTMGLGAFNDNVIKNALAALLVFESVRMAGLNTDQLVNFSAMLFILPYFLFSALFGQFADKYEKSMQIRRIKLLEVAIMVLATVGFYFEHIPTLLAVLFLLGLQSTIFGPIKYGILPQVLREEELIGGNALVEMGTFVAILAGTIAGPLLAGVEVPWPYWVSVTGLAVALLGYWYSRGIPKAAAADPDLHINWNIATETIRNLKFINQNRTVLNSVLGISWFWFFGTVFLVQVPSYTQNVLGGDAILMSALLGLFIIGISTGSLLCERLSGGQVEIGLVPLGAFGLTLFGVDVYFASPATSIVDLTASQFFSDAGNLRIVADLVLIGIFGGFYTVPLYALVQSRAHPGHRSRVIAGLNILNALFMVTASVMAMVVLGSQGFTIPELFLLTAILNAVVAIYIFTLVPEFLMRFLVWLLIHTVYRVRSRGMDNIPRSGPVILACNHVSFVDPLIVGGLVRRPVRFVMYYRIYNLPLLKFIFKTSKAIPIAGRKEDPAILEAAFERMHEVLQKGEVLGIFPEGRITEDGEVGAFKAGVERLVAERPLPVVPMALCNLWGSFFSRRDPPHKRGPRKLWAKIELRIGPAIPPGEVSAERLRDEVTRLRGDDR